MPDRDPTPQDVKAAIGLLNCITEGSDLALEPIHAEALIRHINSLYIKGFNFGMRSILHAEDLAKERARSVAAGTDPDEDGDSRTLRPHTPAATATHRDQTREAEPP